MGEFQKPKRYVPGPGEPALPPQLAQLSDKSVDEVMEELNRSPFFMTQIDESDGKGGENMELEALKALAYDGEPDEVATNFKNQGNGQFKIKLFKNAVEYYDKGLAVKCDVSSINAALYLNRAACNLELKNYRRCINDCKESLKLDPTNIKAYFRMAKAFFTLEKFDEAKQALDFSFKFDAENKSSLTLLEQIINRENTITKIAKKKEEQRLHNEKLANNLISAISIRDYKIIKTSNPAEMLEDAKLELEDAEDIESQLVFPAMILYPTTDEFDFIASVSELSTPLDIMNIVLQRPEEWFKDQKHINFTSKKLDAYMETETGGLVKIGKKASLHKALSTPQPRIPLFDSSIRLYLVPRVEAESWLANWDKELAVKKRYDL
ncbi:hypothetical protein WICMUC_001536 [Wickerhamomyces mucosus]|uniref:Cns1/TTC4 wheel domain-containing protein n=1 Tax=Wickerhamomyces mucosus TaxID=1378264 RepID=A0A9P8PW86_9ASCO|nr:hypothetical protein WICMUC_001536 [Wickerhamomyces mucosus]